MVRKNHASPPRPGGYREMWRIAAPLILSMGAFTIMQFCDRVMLSRYNSVSIQAAIPAGVLAHTLICLFQAIAGYSGTFTAHYFGAKRPDQCVHSTVQGLWLALAAYPLILLLLPVGVWILSISDHAPGVFAEELSYFRILMVTGIVVPLNAAVGGYFIGTGRTRINLLASVIGCLLNIGLNAVMIFGLLGFPEMGIRGAAYATALSSLVTFIIQMILFLRAGAVRNYVSAKNDPAARRAHAAWRIWRPDLPLLKRILRFGTPSGIQLFMDLGSFTLFIMLTGRMGDVEQAASNIAFSINHLAFAPLLGFGMAASTVVGQHQGARNTPAAERAGGTALRMGLIYMTLIGITFIFFPREYFVLFNPRDATFTPEELLGIGRQMLIMATVWGFFDSISLILCGALKGAGDTRFVMIYMGIGGWLFFVPGSLALVWLGYGILALWYWLALYVCLFAIGVWVRWHRGHWKHIRLIHHDPPPFSG
ncbi:MAG: MATE family efflux transporter [Kiritimatiellaeota bacterium]|nr:MATE family efflux transporter [Kiritimatiellota bacterium]